jgi:hypothetical protein
MEDVNESYLDYDEMIAELEKPINMSNDHNLGGVQDYAVSGQEYSQLAPVSC